jgi:hypothetical protein
VATTAFGEVEVVAEAPFAADVEAGLAESVAEAGAGTRSPSLASAKTGDPKNTNSMAATATLTQSPPDVSANARLEH